MSQETTKRTYTGKNRVAPQLTRQQYKGASLFSVEQAAGLFNKTAVRIWQLVNDGVLKFTDVAKEGSTRRRIRLGKDAIAKLREHFGVAKMNYAEAVAADQTEDSADQAA